MMMIVLPGGDFLWLHDRVVCKYRTIRVHSRAIWIMTCNPIQYIIPTVRFCTDCAWLGTARTSTACIAGRLHALATYQIHRKYFSKAVCRLTIPTRHQSASHMRSCAHAAIHLLAQGHRIPRTRSNGADLKIFSGYC